MAQSISPDFLKKKITFIPYTVRLPQGALGNIEITTNLQYLTMSNLMLVKSLI